MKAIKKNLYYAILFVCATLCSLALFGGFAMRRAFAETVESAYNPTMVSGASVRIMDEEKGIKDGIRFMMTMSSDEYEAIKTQEGFKSGILIMPTAVSGSDSMEIGTTNVGVAETQGKWYIVYDNQEKTEYHYACCAVLTDMGAENYRTAISARGYVYTSADGYIYTDYSVGENSRTMKDVAEVAVGKTEKYDELYSLYQYISAGEIANGYVYEANGEIYSLPTFGEEKPEYTVTNASGEVAVLNGNKVKLDAAGEYTATMGENTVKFTAYSSADWARMIAPMTSNQYEEDFEGWTHGKTTVTYDEKMNAFKVASSEVPGNGSGVTLKDGSNTYQKWMANYANYPYVAFDFNFTGQIGTDFTGIAFALSSSSFLFMKNMNIYDTELVITATQATMTKDVWYTVYVPSYALGFQNASSKDWMLFVQQYNPTFSEYYVRNIRFESALPTVTNSYVSLVNGNMYATDAQYLLPSYAYTVTKGGDPVETNGRLVTFPTTGEYVATDGTNTITVTVVAAEEYDRIIAPLNSASTQFNGDFITRANSWSTFTYDTEMGAYKQSYVETITATTSYNENKGIVAIKANSEVYAKYMANWQKYSYVAFELCVDGTFGTDYKNFLLCMNGGRNYTAGLKYLDSTDVMRYDVDGNDVAAKDFVTRTWYTVYVPLTKELGTDYTVHSFITQTCTTDGNFADYWMRNVRFESGLPA